MRLIDRINPSKRKSPSRRLAESVEDTISKPMGRRIKLPDPPSGKTVRTGLLGLAGAVGVTGASAGISSLRRRGEAPRDDS